MWAKIFLFVFGMTAVSCLGKFYRTDYHYLEKYDAFYKFTSSSENWTSAFLTCEDDGAGLFYPNSHEEWVDIMKFTSELYSMSDENMRDIFVGVHDKFGLGDFVTIHGDHAPLPVKHDNQLFVEQESVGGKCLTMNRDSDVMYVNSCIPEPGTTRPFICKKVADVTCPTSDINYKYNSVTNKCYKMNNKARTWTEAMRTCFMEGAVLVVPSKDLDDAFIIRNMPYSNEMSYYAGFRKIFPIEEFYTLKGHRLQGSDYHDWYNNEYGYNNYDCGAIYIANGNLLRLTKDCYNKLPFICEMNVSKISTE